MLVAVPEFQFDLEVVEVGPGDEANSASVRRGWPEVMLYTCYVNGNGGGRLGESAADRGWARR